MNSVQKIAPLLSVFFAKYTQPAIDSLFKLKDKIKNTPNKLDDYCFNQVVSAIETFANYLLGVVKELKA